MAKKHIQFMKDVIVRRKLRSKEIIFFYPQVVGLMVWIWEPGAGFGSQDSEMGKFPDLGSCAHSPGPQPGI
jgi:hypothetical protein